MDWHIKMDKVIVDVLGEEYAIRVLSENMYQVLFNNTTILETETLSPISSHWRALVKKSIDMIIDRRVSASLSKL